LAKVISLYPELISGRLSVACDQWIQMFLGLPKALREAISSLPSLALLNMAFEISFRGDSVAILAL
jgi:hypothetical protein